MITSLVLGALLCAQTDDPTPSGQAEESLPRRSDALELVPTTWTVQAAGLWSSFDSELGLEDAPGASLELQMRLDEAYYYKLGFALWETETEDLAANEDVDIRSGCVGIGMDTLFHAFPSFSLDMGVAAALQRYSAEVDSDSGWTTEVELVARFLPSDRLAIRIGGFLDVAKTSFRQLETESMNNWTALIGIELRY